MLYATAIDIVGEPDGNAEVFPSAIAAYVAQLVVGRAVTLNAELAFPIFAKKCFFRVARITATGETGEAEKENEDESADNAQPCVYLVTDATRISILSDIAYKRQEQDRSAREAPPTSGNAAGIGLVSAPSLALNEIGGLAKELALVRETVELPLTNPGITIIR
jgi:hypothetical protein